LSSELSLELPRNNLSIRLLRDPFASTVAEIQTTASAYTGSGLLFDITGTKLFTRTAKWGVTAFNVPNSPRAGAGRPRSYRTRKWQTVSAVGRLGRGIALISAENRFARLEYCRQGPGSIPPGDYGDYDQHRALFAPSPDDGPLMPCFSLPWDGEIAAVDGAGSLFRFSPLKGEYKFLGRTLLTGTLHLVATQVLAVTILGSRFIYVGREWPDNQLRIVSIGNEISRKALLEEKALRAFFGPPSTLAHSDFGLLALEETNLQWLVISNKGIQVLVKPAGAKVLGVLTDECYSEPGLLALEDDLQTVTLNGHDWRKEIFRAHAPVKHAAMCSRRPDVAYSTVDNEIVVYSLRHGADLCRYLPEGEK
jgi:hypothetical protein